MLDNERQDVVMNSICHAAAMAGEVWQQAAGEFQRPSVLYRPSIQPDGNKWCALYGDNLQEGVAGFGDTPDLAMRDFDKNWCGQKLTAVARSASDA